MPRPSWFAGRSVAWGRVEKRILEYTQVEQDAPVSNANMPAGAGALANLGTITTGKLSGGSRGIVRATTAATASSVGSFAAATGLSTSLFEVIYFTLEGLHFDTADTAKASVAFTLEGSALGGGGLVQRAGSTQAELRLRKADGTYVYTPINYDLLTASYRNLTLALFPKASALMLLQDGVEIGRVQNVTNYADATDVKATIRVTTAEAVAHYVGFERFMVDTEDGA